VLYQRGLLLIPVHSRAGHKTQVGRALPQLGIEHIASYSPQARGRSERASDADLARFIASLTVRELHELLSWGHRAGRFRYRRAGGLNRAPGRRWSIRAACSPPWTRGRLRRQIREERPMTDFEIVVAPVKPCGGAPLECLFSCDGIAGRRKTAPMTAGAD
jgi:hypothetical protein